MQTSNLIALGALIVALIGLIPSFYQAFSKKKIVAGNKIKQKTQLINTSTTTSASPDNANTDENKMPYMLRILLLVIFAVASFLIEIIIFSIIAHYLHFEVNPDSMPYVWKIVFYSLFFIPGVFLFLAFLTFVANTTD